MSYLVEGLVDNMAMMEMSSKKQKKSVQKGDLVEMCWDPRYSDLKMGIVIGLQGEYAEVMWKEGDITIEYPPNLDLVSKRVREDIPWYNINNGGKHEKG